MLDQSSYLGYQPSNTEVAAQEENESNNLLTLLGGGSLGTGLAIAGDITQRAKSSSGEITRESLQKAANEFGMDIKTAASVISGRSQYDKDRKNNISTEPTIRKYAERNAGTDNYISTDFEPEYTLDDHLHGREPQKQGYRKNRLTQAAIAARSAFQPSSEDFIAVKREINRRQGKNPEGPRGEVAVDRMPLVDGIREVFGGYSDDHMNVRRSQNIDLMKQNAHQQVGSILGRTASDAVNNGVRSFWWLVNAPQAVSDLVSEQGAGWMNRDGLYGADELIKSEAENRQWIDSKGAVMDNDVRVRKPNVLADDIDLDILRKYMDMYPEAKNRRIRDLAEIEREKNLGKDEAEINNLIKNKVSRYDPIYSRKRTNNNLSTLLALPAAVGINAGLGLVTPFGGSEGRKAIFPSDEDPSKTSNVFTEIAAKYFLGRQGDLLPWEEFKKVRPDVSKSDYMSYKGYRFNKKEDWNILDGDFNIANGILKGDADGIDGAEIMFLGKSMPVNTVLAPTGLAVIGAAAGAGLGKHGILNLTGLEDDEKDLASLEKFYNDYSSDEANVTHHYNLHDDQVRRDVQNMKKQIDERKPRIEARRKIMDNPLMRGIGNRLRKTNPIVTGLVGGAAALGAGALIGGEAERRRREGKIQERQERGY
ncbi:hypothetical protein [Synechococcus sp. WH 8016]|uniref:hypothetical protein n=1 Tax=Synechococcus sp. WH 8016 TaxID=166318 RepID=UPI00022DA148|nr:hypothetical protein [Synechococcus sp. WH 8016]EHA63720.1 hypothetical protein Syn8016DRAFT_0761 [Synechococcus sp. WH 8016]